MRLLLSRLPALRTTHSAFPEIFLQQLETADSLIAASGYISTDSLTELKKIIELNGKPRLELLIGMHNFDGFTKPQYEAAQYLDDFLQEKKLGDVYIATTTQFHGKMYSFYQNNKPVASIIGSSNLSNLVDTHRLYEADVFLEEPEINKTIDEFLTPLPERIGIKLSSWEVKPFIEKNALLENHERVEKVDPATLLGVFQSETNVSFKLPIKGDQTPQSNLNAYFGRGRVNQRGFVQPRHWYEVEIIVPKAITEHPSYPKAGYPDKESVITVYTDDGWKFNCKISGQNSKNFRSEDDLKILGRWVKGRLENSGALKVGTPVTDETLRVYGKNYVELSATEDPAIWLLDFSPDKHD